jgi:flavodoxin
VNILKSLRLRAVFAPALCVLLMGAVLPLHAAEPAPADTNKEAPMLSSKKILVLYYSRTGTTAKLADAIAKTVGADVERLEDTVNRAGFMGFMRSLMDAIRKRGTTLKPLTLDPTVYELVIIGTPDWGKSVSAPMRTFLETYRGRLHQVAFFLTDGKADHDAIFREMASLVGKEPVAVLGIPHNDVVQDRYLGQVDVFVKSLPTLTASP